MADTVNILYHLAAEYNNIIFAASSSYTPRDINSAEELSILIDAEANELDDLNTRLQVIEDEMMIFMSLSAGKRRL